MTSLEDFGGAPTPVAEPDAEPTAVEATAPAVVDRKTGEVLVLEDAPDEQLAAFCTNLQDLRAELGEAEALVHQELVARLDRNASWTLRVGDPESSAQWEITAPSPTAGTESYPEVELEVELAGLVDEGTISPDAADAALERVVVVKVTPGWGVDLQSLIDAISASTEVEVAGIPVTVVKASTERKSKAGAIAKLRKVPDAVEALDRVRVIAPVGPRRPRVKLVARGGRP